MPASWNGEGEAKRPIPSNRTDGAAATSLQKAPATTGSQQVSGVKASKNTRYGKMGDE